MHVARIYTAGTGRRIGKVKRVVPGEVLDVKNGVDVGELERHLRRDVGPGPGRRVSVQEMQTGPVGGEACSRKIVHSSQTMNVIRIEI